MTITEALCILAAGKRDKATHYANDPWHEAERVVEREASRVRYQAEHDALASMLPKQPEAPK